MEDTLGYVKKLKFFSTLNDEYIDIVKHMAKPVKHAKNSILYYENDTNWKL